MEVPLRAGKSHPGHWWGLAGVGRTPRTTRPPHRTGGHRLAGQWEAGSIKKEWWGVEENLWSRPEGGKGQGRGASQPAWRPAQNADSGWGPANPRMQVGRRSQRVTQNDKKG